MTEKLTGISGSMAAGKTDRIIELARREGFKKHNVLAFKPALDNRWDSKNLLVSRTMEGEVRKSFPAYSINTSQELLQIVVDYLENNHKLDHVYIDEVQFFDEQIVDVIKLILDLDIPVTFGGLALDFRGEPFGQMPVLLSLSDQIETLTAICEVCGDNATRTQRLINNHPANYNDPIVLIGAEQNYQARCVKHHEVPNKPKPLINHR